MMIPRTEAVSSVPPMVAPIILNVLKDGAVATSGVVEINGSPELFGDGKLVELNVSEATGIGTGVRTGVSTGEAP